MLNAIDWGHVYLYIAGAAVMWGAVNGVSGPNVPPHVAWLNNVMTTMAALLWPVLILIVLGMVAFKSLRS